MKRLELLSMVYVLALATLQSRADTVISNLGASDVGALQAANDVWCAVKFTTDNQQSFLNSVTLSAEAFNNNGSFSVNIYSDGAGLPGALLSGGHLTGANPTSRGLYTYNATSPLELMPNTSYHLVVHVDGPGFGQFFWRAGAAPAAGDWEAATAYQRVLPLGFWNDTAISPIFAIDATPVPEPSTPAIAGFSLALLAWFKRQRSLSK